MSLPKSLNWLDLERLAATVPLPGWERYGHCAGEGPEGFYPAGRGDNASVQAARKVCRGCPVLYACLASALSEEASSRRHGVWGATSAAQRAKIHRALAAREVELSAKARRTA